MLRKILFFTSLFLFSFNSFGSQDPNLNSFVNAGECSDIATNNSCGECPLKKQKLTLATSTKQAPPADEGFESEETETNEEGVN